LDGRAGTLAATESNALYALPTLLHLWSKRV
jgi:hypothetical protein